MPVLTPTHSRPTSNPAATIDAIRILADDLSGACDSAAAFLHVGHTVRVWLGATATEAATEAVQAFNTSSRNLPAADVQGVISNIATALRRDGQTLLFKKVDSAGRGHIAAEVIAAHQALGASAVLFAPSFPAAGRTVHNGILFIADASGTRSCVPLLPLFEEQASTAHISYPGQIPQAISAGFTILVCDASTQSDLEALTAVEYLNLLYAGSAGLARALATRYISAVPSAPISLPRIATALTICGTPHPVTRLQLRHLTASHPNHPMLQIRAEEYDRRAIQAAFDRHAPDALVLTGGDTALLVLTTLGAESIVLRGELAPGIPWGIIQGGAAQGRVVITKSGGFGSVDALSKIVKGLT